jgi:hypothetical protein
MLEENLQPSRSVLTLVVGSGPRIVVCPSVLTNVMYAVIGIVSTTFEVISKTLDVAPLSVVVVIVLPSESVVVIVCMSSNVEVDSNTVWLVLKLFDTVGAVIVVTIACVDTGTSGDARIVHTCRRRKQSSNIGDSMLALGASAPPMALMQEQRSIRARRDEMQQAARRQSSGQHAGKNERDNTRDPEIGKGLGRKGEGKGDVNSPHAFQRYQQIREIPGRLFQDRKRKSFPRLDVGATTSSSQR